MCSNVFYNQTFRLCSKSESPSERSATRLNEHRLRLVLHGNAYGKTHRINANAIAKKRPSTRNIHRIVSVHTDGSVYIQPLEKLQYICRACRRRCNFLHKSSDFLHKSSEEEWLSWLHVFCRSTCVKV